MFFLPLDVWLVAFGSTWILDILNLYPYSILSILGIILSSFALAIFQDEEFNIPLYKYLRIYTTNSIVNCVLSLGNIFWSVRRIIPWSNSYFTQVYALYVFLPFATMCYFFSSVLDILILLDRIGHFNKKLKGFMTMPVYKMCAIEFVFCFVFNFPTFWSIILTRPQCPSAKPRPTRFGSQTQHLGLPRPSSAKTGTDREQKAEVFACASFVQTYR
jgi:hypothetical protein